MGGGGSGAKSDCETIAESTKHKVWKGFAADALLNMFGEGKVESWAGFDDGEKRELLQERSVDAPASEKEWRVGDVVMNFDERDEQLGNGIILEVQYKNKSKDENLVAKDYIEQDYSVVWLYEDDFAKDHCRLD